MEAAFFDLDKTVIARPSMMAFARSFRREGLVTRRTLARGAWLQLVYVRWGAGPKRLARIQQAALAVTAGWEQTAVRRIVDAELAAAIDPITYRGAVDLIGEHRRAGRRVYLVSAGPEEIVEPVGRHLGVDEVIASRAVIDAAGRYTGVLERYVYGSAKAALVRDLAQREGIDLEASWAYTDSITDLPMLEVVGHPVAANPDRALRRIAQMRGWTVVRFEERGGFELTVRPTPALPVTPVAVDGEQRRWGVAPVSMAAVLATTGGVTAWWWRHRLSIRSA